MFCKYRKIPKLWEVNISVVCVCLSLHRGGRHVTIVMVVKNNWVVHVLIV